MPVCYHIGENTGFEAKGALGTNVLHNVGGPGFRATFGQLMFGGVFDNYPTLRVGFIEANLHWIAGMLQDADMVSASFRTLLDYTPKLSAQEYWRRHCYASFMYDPMGLENVDRIGIDTVMWSTDYPHNESTFGYTGDTINWVIETVGEESAGKVVGGNALRFFGL
jgi:predicted TIM-barrel fold metal-dependent hydrolase